MNRNSERGAAAVEFAILAPILIVLLLGIMEFGRAYNVQITLSNAAREGSRVMAITSNAMPAASATASAQTQAISAAAALNPALVKEQIAFSYQAIPATTPAPTACAANVQVTATISYTLKSMTGIAGPFAMRGVGTMQCGG